MQHSVFVLGTLPWIGSDARFPSGVSDLLNKCYVGIQRTPFQHTSCVLHARRLLTLAEL